MDALKALSMARLGQGDDARRLIRGTIAERSIGPKPDSTPSGFLAVLLEASVLVEDKDSAEILSRRLSDANTVVIAPYAYSCVTRIVGAAAALLGQHDRARVLYQRALEALGKVRFRPQICVTSLFKLIC